MTIGTPVKIKGYNVHAVVTKNTGNVVDVDIQDYVASYYTETIYTCVVRYKDGRYYFDVIKAKTVQSDINGYAVKDVINFEDVENDDCNVIGNKYENPELLEVKR